MSNPNKGHSHGPSVLVLNETVFSLSGKALREEVGRMADFVSRRYRKKISEIDLAFLKPAAVQKLNKHFLKKDKTTDILTFASKIETGMGAELAINLVRVLKDAKSDERDAREYLAEVILHGLLHTVGVDHDYSTGSLRKVHALQRRLLDEFRPELKAFAVKKKRPG
ncbi:MAG: rRNA maturation RNase YbeY [Spirochaetia bacterium]|nr:rRNA maturation RNase YbeY [Spirochaetia bacterium]